MNQSIVGRWEMQPAGSGVFWEFTSGGTYKSTKLGIIVSEGLYETRGNMLILDKGTSGELGSPFRLDGDALLLEGPGFYYKRVPTYVENKDSNERSMASKILWGTWLTNGLFMSGGGIIAFFWGLNMRNSIDHQFHRALGGTDYAGLFAAGGVILFMVGIGCICVHLAKKK